MGDTKTNPKLQRKATAPAATELKFLCENGVADEVLVLEVAPSLGVCGEGHLIISGYLEKLEIAILQGVSSMSPFDSAASEVTAPQGDACWQALREKELVLSTKALRAEQNVRSCPRVKPAASGATQIEMTPRLR